MKKKKFDLNFFYILPGFIGFAIFYIIPFFISIKYTVLDKPLNGNFVGINNFLGLFKNSSYLLGLKNTLFFILFIVPISILISLIFSLMINISDKYKKFFVLIFLIPLVIPSGSITFFLKKFFALNGFFNGLLRYFDFEKIKWLDSNITRYVISIIFIWKNIGYNIVIFLAAISQIPKDYYESADVDGANFLTKFFKITLPFLKNSFFLIFIMSIINNFKIFKEIYLLTGENPHDSIYTLQHFMNNMFRQLNYNRLSTATFILVFILTTFITGSKIIFKKISDDET